MATPSDKALFPFGKFKGIPYGKVPAWYLDHIRDQSWIQSWPEVWDYLNENRAAIDLELEESNNERTHQ